MRRLNRADVRESKTLDDAADGRVRRSQRSRAAMVQALFDLVGEGAVAESLVAPTVSLAV